MIDPNIPVEAVLALLMLGEEDPDILRHPALIAGIERGEEIFLVAVKREVEVRGAMSDYDAEIIVQHKGGPLLNALMASVAAWAKTKWPRARPEDLQAAVEQRMARLGFPLRRSTRLGGPCG